MDLFRRLFGGRRDTKPLSPINGDSRAEAGPDDDLDAGPEALNTPLQTRPLPPPAPFAEGSKLVRYGQASDIGQTRDINQDAALGVMASPDMASDPPAIGFFVVADGMGGHHDGELASAIAVQTMARRVLTDIITPHLDAHEYSSEQKTIPEVLTESIHDAHYAVLDRVTDGGTTVTCAVIRGDLAYIAHVGDSRAYLITEGNLEVITRDHSLVKRLQELGTLTSAEAEVDPRRNVLYRAVGQGEIAEVDTATRRLPPGSRLMICSDGLWGVIGDERIAEITAANLDPQRACEEMVAEANERGGPDNITVLLVEMPH